MSNNLRSLMPRIVARGLLTMRQKAIFPRLVNADFSAEAAKKGDIIDVPLSQKIDAEDVRPSHQPPSPPDTNAQSVKITLNHWKKASFHLTDKDMDQIEAHESFVPLQMAEAIQALATAVNQSVIDVMQDTTSEVGTFLEAPFAPVSETGVNKMPSQGLQAVIDARRHLNQVSAPKTGRAFVLNYDAEAQFLGLGHNVDMAPHSASGFALDGEIGRRLGFDFYATDQLERDGRGPILGRVMTTQSTNRNKLTVSLIAGRFRIGDLVVVKSDPDRHYDIHTLSTYPDKQLMTFTSSTRHKAEKDELVGLSSGVTSGFAFQRDGVALAMRPLASTGLVSGHSGQMMTITDPESGLSLRLEVSRQYKQTVWEFDILWGVSLIRPEYVVKLQGR